MTDEAMAADAPVSICLVDTEVLARQFHAILEDDVGWHVESLFDSIPTRCQIVAATDGHAPGGLASHASAASHRLTDLRTIVAKLEWMRELRDDGTLDKHGFMFFAANDVVSFMTTVRSFFDHLCATIASAAASPGSTPDSSFQNLRSWVGKGEVDERTADLGQRTYELVASCDWFAELRDLRDELIHRGAEAIVFPGEPGITFQAYTKKLAMLINDPTLAATENTVHFERFAAAVMARLWEFSEDVGREIVDRHHLAVDLGAYRSTHFGLGTVHRWTGEILDAT